MCHSWGAANWDAQDEFRCTRSVHFFIGSQGNIFAQDSSGKLAQKANLVPQSMQHSDIVDHEHIGQLASRNTYQSKVVPFVQAWQLVIKEKLKVPQLGVTMTGV